jgi:hypothetical protein
MELSLTNTPTTTTTSLKTATNRQARKRLIWSATKPPREMGCVDGMDLEQSPRVRWGSRWEGPRTAPLDGERGSSGRIPNRTQSPSLASPFLRAGVKPRAHVEQLAAMERRGTYLRRRRRLKTALESSDARPNKKTTHRLRSCRHRIDAASGKHLMKNACQRHQPPFRTARPPPYSPRRRSTASVALPITSRMRSTHSRCSGFIRTERRQVIVSRSRSTLAAGRSKNATGNSASARWR